MISNEEIIKTAFNMARCMPSESNPADFFKVMSVMLYNAGTVYQKVLDLKNSDKKV
jgi:hypothetical protein